ncbi:MAG: succinylglutamate desuccinylase/aspartoacylase family protein [Planctomycetaceae bacterium]
MTGYTLHADPAIHKAQRNMARAFNLPVIWGTAANLDGRSLSVARDAGVPAIYTEYLGAGRCAPQGVTAYMEGCLNVMGHLKMIQRVRPKSRIEVQIEDPRPSSGHMQVQNPSPIAGHFTAACTLGQEVRKGDILGSVSNITGSETHDVISTQTGYVLAIRRFARVLADHFMVVVMETDFKDDR